MTGRQFIARVRGWAKSKGLTTRFNARQGAGSHGTLYVGKRKTTVPDRKRELPKGLLNKMLADLRIPKDEFPRAGR